MLRAFGPPPAWTTIVGGSRRYVDALAGHLVGDGVELRCATPVARIARDARGVTIGTRAGAEARYDRVVIATHADVALELLAPPSAAERAVLGAFRYSENRTVLHTDRTFLPRHARAHAAWNYVADPDTSRVAVTYSMTKLQGLPDRPYLVTLNPRREPAGALHATTFAHPQFDRAALAAQPHLPGLGAAHRTYYAGAHFGFGFHEDGACAGLAAAASLLADRLRPGLPVQP
jgi:predicted NAD/FAD-binding protein